MYFENKVIEMLSILINRQDYLLEIIDDFRKEIRETSTHQEKTFGSISCMLDQIKKRQENINEQLVLLNQSVLLLEERVNHLAHEERIQKLENFMRKASWFCPCKPAQKHTGARNRAPVFISDLCTPETKWTAMGLIETGRRFNLGEYLVVQTACCARTSRPGGQRYRAATFLHTMCASSFLISNF